MYCILVGSLHEEGVVVASDGSVVLSAAVGELAALSQRRNVTQSEFVFETQAPNGLQWACVIYIGHEDDSDEENSVAQALT